MMLLWPPKKIIYLENFQISLDPPPTFGELYCRCFSETPNIHLIESDPPPNLNWEISPQKIWQSQVSLIAIWFSCDVLLLVVF